MGLSLEHFLPSLKVMARGTHGSWDIRGPLTRVLSEEVISTYTDIMHLCCCELGAVFFISIHWFTCASSPFILLSASTYMLLLAWWFQDLGEAWRRTHSFNIQDQAFSYLILSYLNFSEKCLVCVLALVFPLLIAVRTAKSLKGLRALFTCHVIGPFFMQERALIRGWVLMTTN